MQHQHPLPTETPQAACKYHAAGVAQVGSQQQAAAPALWHLEHRFSAPAKAMQVRQHCVSRELGERAFAGRTQHREPDLGHEAKLRDLEVVKNVHRDAALVTRGAGAHM